MNLGLIQSQSWAYWGLTGALAPLSFPAMKTRIASIDVRFEPGRHALPVRTAVPNSLLLLGLIRGCRVR